MSRIRDTRSNRLPRASHAGKSTDGAQSAPGRESARRFGWGDSFSYAVYGAGAASPSGNGAGASACIRKNAIRFSRS